jgi:hypothetical protein
MDRLFKAQVGAGLESSGNGPDKAGSAEFCARQPIVLEWVGLAGWPEHRDRVTAEFGARLRAWQPRGRLGTRL